MFEEALYDLAERTKKRRGSEKPSETEAISEDGLMYCNVCKKPKQIRIEIPLVDGLKVITPYVPCDCEQKVIDERERKDAERMFKERREKLRAKSRIDERYYDATFDNGEPAECNRKAFEQCKRYAMKFGDMSLGSKGLLLFGTVGSGKTYASACIANHLMENLISVYMISAVDLLKLRTVEEDENLFDIIESVKLLIIDDIGSERSTEYGVERIYNAIDCRWNSKKPMIVTTNLTLQEMLSPKDNGQARVYDRIIEMCYPIEFTGESFRRKSARANFDEMKKTLGEDR